jgi:hypothetical protein
MPSSGQALPMVLMSVMAQSTLRNFCCTQEQVISQRRWATATVMCLIRSDDVEEQKLRSDLPRFENVL